MRYLYALSMLIIMIVSACTGSTPSPEVIPSFTSSSKPIVPSVTPTLFPQTSTTAIAPTSTIIPSVTPEVKVEEVNFSTSDNIKLAGTVFGEGDLAVILAHMGMPNVDQQSWQPFARSLAARGFTVLTFDFRGRGESTGFLEYNKLPYDMEAAIQFLNERGFSRIICVGASMGGTACMRAAMDHDLVALGVIASVLSNGKPNEVSTSEVRQLNLPKILVYGISDFPAVVMDMKIISEFAPEPKIIQVYPTNAHGTNIFDTEYGDQFSELLTNFLEAVRSGNPLPTP